jgi:hypothetical protein
MMKIKNTEQIYFILLAVIMFIVFSGFQPIGDSQSFTHANKFENRFFTLDFKNNKISLEDFESCFFTTFPHPDPTLGSVIYDRSLWKNGNMIEVVNGDGFYSYVKFRDDSTGFDSFRFTTKAFFNLNENTEKLLFVFKGKLPSINGSWPAWWLNGSSEDTWTYREEIPAIDDETLNRYSGIGTYYDTPSSVNSTDWPSGGEIDLIENINGENFVHNTIHTCPQMCDSEWNNNGEIINCANAKPGDVNPGCSGEKYEVSSLQGTFACVWERKTIIFYYWNPEADVRMNGGPLSAKPNPQLWIKENLKNRVKLFESDSVCDNEKHKSWQCEKCEGSNECEFKNLKMIFNVTLCGVWAGNKFDSTDTPFQNCQEYILGEGKSKINNQYMKIEYVSVKKL